MAARKDPGSTPALSGCTATSETALRGGAVSLPCARPIQRGRGPSGEGLAEPALHGRAQRLERHVLVGAVRRHLDLVVVLDLEGRHGEHAPPIGVRGPSRDVADADDRPAMGGRGPHEGRTGTQVDAGWVADREPDRLHGSFFVIVAWLIAARSAVGRSRVRSQAEGSAAATSIRAAINHATITK